jgi:S-DNA-T family DNA segregation ATPase FtsK/SpoIIIE
MHIDPSAGVVAGQSADVPLEVPPLEVVPEDVPLLPAVVPELLPVEPEAVPAVEPEAVPAVEPEAVPAVEPEAVPAVEPEAVPAVEPEAVPAVEPEAVPAVELPPDEEAVLPPSSSVPEDELDPPPQPTPMSAVTANTLASPPTAARIWKFLLTIGIPPEASARFRHEQLTPVTVPPPS